MKLPVVACWFSTWTCRFYIRLAFLFVCLGGGTQKWKLHPASEVRKTHFQSWQDGALVSRKGMASVPNPFGASQRRQAKDERGTGLLSTATNPAEPKGRESFMAVGSRGLSNHFCDTSWNLPPPFYRGLVLGNPFLGNPCFVVSHSPGEFPLGRICSHWVPIRPDLRRPSTNRRASLKEPWEGGRPWCPLGSFSSRGLRGVASEVRSCSSFFVLLLFFPRDAPVLMLPTVVRASGTFARRHHGSTKKRGATGQRPFDVGAPG